MIYEPHQMISHYRLVEKIGEGGMGIVWKAIDTHLDREVAIKFLPEHLQSDPQRLAQFEREAKAVAALNHPNIVTIYSVEEWEGSRFLTLELVLGKTLAELIPEEGFPLDRFLKVAVPLTDAISAAHERGVTHRDLKPGNIMVSHEGRVKVLDFGLARPLMQEELTDASKLPTRSRSEGGSISGTIPYMSPEQVRGRSLDHRSDIFSTGTILYEMAVGRCPFAGETPADVIASILRDEPRPVTEIKPDLPPEIWGVIRRSLKKDPDRRPQSALDLRNDLEQILRSTGALKEEIPPSIAVLPFVDMSPEKDQDYLCEGIAEEIINALTKIHGLHVASRTSSFQFKAAGLESRDIGRRLRVANLLEGSVRKAGERLRITVDLTDVAGGYNLWSESYDREAKDIFAIQEDIGRSVVQALQVTLSQRERHALEKMHTKHVNAYLCYLRGRKFYYEYRRRTIEFALQMFERAIEHDPTYALAYAGIADCCSFLYLYAGRGEANRRRAEEASRKALDLDPDLALVHASRGVALTLSGRHDEAEAAFENAIRLDPRLFEAHYFYARDCFVRGMLEKAARLYEQASEVRPEDYQSVLLVAQIYEDIGRKFAAEAARRRGIRVAQQLLELNPDDARAVYFVANALAALGEREQGLEWCRRAMRMDPEDSMLLYNVGCIMSLAGEYEEAINCLEKCVDTGLSQKEWFQMDSNLDPLRNRPRFQALMKRFDEAI